MYLGILWDTSQHQAVCVLVDVDRLYVLAIHVEYSLSSDHLQWMGSGAVQREGQDVFVDYVLTPGQNGGHRVEPL